MTANPKTVHDNAKVLSDKAQELFGENVKGIFIAESPMVDREDDYESPYRLVVDIDPSIPSNMTNLFSFNEFCKKSLSHSGIMVSIMQLLELDVSQNTILSEKSKYLLDNLININDVNPDLPWKEQFDATKQKSEATQAQAAAEGSSVGHNLQAEGTENDSPLRRQEQRNEIFGAILSSTCPGMSKEEIDQIILSMPEESKSKIARSADLNLIQSGKRSAEQQSPSSRPQKLQGVDKQSVSSLAAAGGRSKSPERGGE